MIVWAHVPPTMCSPETPVLVEDLDGDREWRVARTISYVHGGKVPVRLCNPHPFEIVLPQRQALTAVSQIESQEVQATAWLGLQPMGPQEVEVRVCQVQTVANHQTSRAAATEGCMGEHPALKLQGDGLSPEEQQRLTATSCISGRMCLRPTMRILAA